MVQLDLVAQLGKLFHPNFPLCVLHPSSQAKTTSPSAFASLSPPWLEGRLHPGDPKACCVLFPPWPGGGWAGIHLPDLFWELCSSELCVPLAGPWKPLAVFILEGCWKWHHPWVQCCMGLCWHISVGVSPRELPCDPQLLKGRDSECQNPNPKLLSARFLLTGLV